MKLKRVCLGAALFLLGASALAVGEEQQRVRRLESVTWNPVKSELTWVVSSGARPTQGEYNPEKQQTYVINMSAATMTFDGETRRFSKQEAANVRSLMAVISTYAVESTVWWEQGNGQKVMTGERVHFSLPEPSNGSQCTVPPLVQLAGY